LHELWALLNFVLPDEFHSSEAFLSFFTQPQPQEEERSGEGGGQGGVLEGRGLAELQGLLAPLMLRRIKQDVEQVSVCLCLCLYL
jgi:SNF2 family DNA or RNA helicase